jgi:hypothetical protein
MAWRPPEVNWKVTDASTQRDVSWVGFLHIGFLGKHCDNKQVIGVLVIDGWPKGTGLCAISIDRCEVAVFRCAFF